MGAIESKFRTIALDDVAHAQEGGDELLRLISEGYRIESALATSYCLYYVLRREAP